MPACHVKLLVCSAAAAVLVASAMRESLALDIYQPDGAVLNPSDPTRQFLRPLDQDSLPSSKFSSSLTSGALNVNMDSNFRDTTRIDGSSFLGFIVGNNAKWQENQVGYTNLNTDLGDTIRVKTRFGASTYDASDQFFASLGKSQDDQRMTRFAGVGFATGTAAQTRVEEDVFSFGDGRVTVFQEFTRVDRFFEDLKFTDKTQRSQTRDDLFSKPDRETSKYGISFSQGLSGVSFSESSISNISDDPASFYRQQRFDSKAWFGPRDLFQQYGVPADSVIGHILPSTVWVSYGQGQARSADTSLPIAEVVDTNAGAGWQWANVYANLSAWRSVETGAQLANSLSTSSVSDGGDVSVGINNPRWNISGYLSISRSNYDDAFNAYNTSTNYSVSSGGSITFLFQRLPNLTLAFDISTYGDAYSALNGSDSGRINTAGFALDFSKYMDERSGQKLQLFYYAKDQIADGLWSGVPTHSVTFAHVFGGTARARW